MKQTISRDTLGRVIIYAVIVMAVFSIGAFYSLKGQLEMELKCNQVTNCKIQTCVCEDGFELLNLSPTDCRTSENK